MREDALKFLSGLLHRANINLEVAESRKDVRAITNIQRKIRIYTYLIKVVSDTEG